MAGVGRIPKVVKAFILAVHTTRICSWNLSVGPISHGLAFPWIVGATETDFTF
ncbi:hypothetical protein SRABI05_03798 [Agrobacterium fabrum]|nr:hypothetical protein SRABI46_03674 [Agrobacterium fabrum]CAH0281284.1 hypothetical protein SRABI05_03798 [Agrobacterium fabrum]